MAVLTNLDVHLSAAPATNPGTRVAAMASSMSNISYELMTIQDLTVAASTVKAVTLGGLTTVNLLMLTSDVPVAVLLNGELTGHSTTFFVANGLSMTTLSIQNAGTSLATLRLAFFGV